MLSLGWNVITRAAPSWWHVNLGTTYLNVPLATLHYLYIVDLVELVNISVVIYAVILNMVLLLLLQATSAIVAWPVVYESPQWTCAGRWERPQSTGTPVEKAPLDAQRPSLPGAQLLFPHVDINLLTVIAHIEQLQFDIGTWVTWDLLTLHTETETRTSLTV